MRAKNIYKVTTIMLKLWTQQHYGGLVKMVSLLGSLLGSLLDSQLGSLLDSLLDLGEICRSV